MKGLLAIIVVGISLTASAGSAEACRYLAPVVRPINHPDATVAQGVVIGGDEHGAEVRLDRIISGQLDGRTVWLEYGTRPTPAGEVVITCGPPGDRVGVGTEVIVALLRHADGQRAIGWMRPEDAERADEFFALYRTEQRPEARRRLLERWREVNFYRGPIPLTDPSRWMAPFAGGLRFEALADRSRATFQVDAEGRVSDCNVVMPDEARARGGRLCARLRRQRFRPPVFARERQGVYEARWGQRLGAPASR